MGEDRFLRSFPAKPVEAVRAANAEVWTASGGRFLDVGGASHGVALVGHNHPRVVFAIQEQARRLIHVAQTIQSPQRAAFLDRLHANLPSALEQTFLGNSGTEVVELALKLGATTGRKGLVALRDSFHGRTIGALSVTSRPAFREPFASLLPQAQFVAPTVEDVQAAVTKETAVMILEPVQGEGGVRRIPKEVLKAARDATTDAGALLVFDEIQSGLCRTGTFLASQMSGVVPDIVLLAKGLAGGLPIGSCSVNPEVAARLPPAGHGGTYGGNPLVCAVGSTVLDILEDDELATRAARLGEDAARRLVAADLPIVREVRHAGLMVGIELRVRPQPVLAALQASGILALTGGTTGIRLLPPLTIDEAHWSEAIEAVLEALRNAQGRPA